MVSRLRAWRRSANGRARRGLPRASGLHYGADMSTPAEMIEREIPDLELPSSLGGTFRLRSRVGVGPLALFFYIRNATPG